jgi:hypothetical protein
MEVNGGSVSIEAQWFDSGSVNAIESKNGHFEHLSLCKLA